MYNYEDVNFTQRNAKIFDKDGNLIFDELVEFPDFYNDNSVNIVSSKYLCNTDKLKETSIKQLFDRVSHAIASWGFEQGYFNNEEETALFCNKLKKYQIHQYFAFNSPVYFNLGLREDPQISACFILGITDSMDSITDVIKTEAKIFKQGSGSGTNLSLLRSKYEKISAGGNASGPTSFLKVQDTSAGVIKSGGTLRRSAKMAMLNIGHPDIEDFIHCKEKEEEKIQALKAAGIQSNSGYDLDDEVFYQNTNISVRVNNQFMNAVVNDDNFSTKYVKSKKIHKTYKARNLLKQIAEQAWEYADPGIIFHDNTNVWNTCKNSGQINATNPCGEYAFLDDSSCNLASINLLRLLNENNHFDFETFEDIISTVITAQDIIVDKASYPTKKIKHNSIKYRPLGLGYTNLGALLMVLGYPYDSEEGRNLAANLTALMTGYAYKTSGELAKKIGAFEKYNSNKIHFANVINKHYNQVLNLKQDNLLKQIHNKNVKIWEQVLEYNSFRNAQVTLLAPTGTISFIMGASTTGIEPEFSHVKYKRLSNSDGSTISITNPLITRTLKNLKYNQTQIENIKNDILNNKPFNQIKELNHDHASIFYTTNSYPHIPYMGHVKMMSAVQPFLSGAISKTINMPEDCKIQDIYDVYLHAWKVGLKGITIYRNNSKSYQPLNNNQINEIHSKIKRRKLPDERKAINHKFTINQNFKGYLSCGLYNDNTLGEIFIDVAKEGSTLSGILKSLAIVTSVSLQYGVPLKDIVEKLCYQKFEPNGFTKNKNIPITNSIVDYIFRYLGQNFLNEDDKNELGLSQIINSITSNNQQQNNSKDTVNGPPCNKCGSIMTKVGACHLCINCGSNEGACG